MTRRKVEFLDVELAEMKSQYEGGKGLRLLADEYSCSIPIIRRELVNAGCTIRPQGRPKTKEAVNAG